MQAITWQPPQPSWLPTGLWYSSLVLDLVAICLATQQSVALNRLSCYKDGLSKIRFVLGHMQPSKDGRPETWEPRRLQLYVWQTPIMLLNFSILLFIIGLSVMIIGAAGQTNQVFTSENAKAS